MSGGAAVVCAVLLMAVLRRPAGAAMGDDEDCDGESLSPEELAQISEMEKDEGLHGAAAGNATSLASATWFSLMSIA